MFQQCCYESRVLEHFGAIVDCICHLFLNVCGTFLNILEHFWTPGHHFGNLGHKVGPCLAQSRILEDFRAKGLSILGPDFGPWATLLRSLGRWRPNKNVPKATYFQITHFCRFWSDFGRPGTSQLRFSLERGCKNTIFIEP